jgi:1,4-dihydroxy-2-naphthoate octaprenyltransferase
VLFTAIVAGAFLTSWVPWFAGALSPWLFLTAAAAPLALGIVATVRMHADGPSLNSALARSAKLALLFCLLLCAGILA